jgi:hypothetical protein
MAVRMMIIEIEGYLARNPEGNPVVTELTDREKEVFDVKGKTYETNTRFVTSWTGCVLRLRERNMYHDSDFYALVWDAEKSAPREVEYGTTRFPTYGNTADVDATPEVLEAYRAWEAQQRAEAAQRRAEEEARTPYPGKKITVTGGRKLPKGTVADVFWRGEDKYRPSRIIPAYRVGVKVNGEKFFLSEDDVEVIIEEKVMTHQDRLNEIATVIWPQHTGDIHPSDVVMKLMEISHEWTGAAPVRCGKIDLALTYIEAAEENPEAIVSINGLGRALTLVREALG